MAGPISSSPHSLTLSRDSLSECANRSAHFLQSPHPYALFYLRSFYYLRPKFPSFTFQNLSLCSELDASSVELLLEYCSSGRLTITAERAPMLMVTAAYLLMVNIWPENMMSAITIGTSLLCLPSQKFIFVSQSARVRQGTGTLLRKVVSS